jgi:hypothetical protein
MYHWEEDKTTYLAISEAFAGSEVEELQRRLQMD